MLYTCDFRFSYFAAGIVAGALGYISAFFGTWAILLGSSFSDSPYHRNCAQGAEAGPAVSWIAGAAQQ